MSVKPISSPPALSVVTKQSEDLRVSGTIQTKDGATVQFDLEYHHSETSAAKLSIGADSAGHRGKKIGYERHHRRERNFEAIDKSGDSTLVKDKIKSVPLSSADTVGTASAETSGSEPKSVAPLSDYTVPQNLGPSGSSDIFFKDPEPVKASLTDYQVQELSINLSTAATVLSSIGGNAPTINVGVSANGKLVIA